MADMEKELHGRLPYHGHSESPLVNGNLVYLVPGGVDTNIVAFDRFSGKIVWISKGLGYGSAYNSPALITLPERKILVTFTAYALIGLDAATGELHFSHDQVNIPVAERKPGMGDTHSNSIWFEDGCIYYFAGDGNGAVKLKLSDDGRKIEQVWRNPTVDNYMGGFIKDGNLIYSCLFEKRKLITMDSRDGSVIDSLAIGRGNIISDGNFLYYYNLRGEVNRVKPGERPSVTGMFKVTEGTKEHFSHPVIDKGVMYLRHGNTLMAYRID
jgi:outer membrane protein assembly factor BamB